MMRVDTQIIDNNDSNSFLHMIVIIQLSLDHDDGNWATPNMPALADVMSKLLRKRIKDDQVELCT